MGDRWWNLGSLSGPIFSKVLGKTPVTNHEILDEALKKLWLIPSGKQVFSLINNSQATFYGSYNSYITIPWCLPVIS